MPEPLKNRYNTAFIDQLSRQIKQQTAQFDAKGFSEYIFDEQWEHKELKQRMYHIASGFHHFISSDYPSTLNVLTTIAPQFSGFEYIFFPGNEHLRRLASEGCRPRLPWAMALPAFKQNPSPILPILTKLKHDNSAVK